VRGVRGSPCCSDDATGREEGVRRAPRYSRWRRFSRQNGARLVVWDGARSDMVF
jgi:hypothetical protein